MNDSSTVSIEQQVSVLRGVKSLLRKEWLIAFRQRSEWVNPLFFFVMVVTLFPLGIGPNPDTLRMIAPGVVWIAALLSTLIAADGLFKPDYEDGSLDQLLIAPQPLFLLVLTKVLSHWAMTGLPLTLLSPVLAAMLNLDASPRWTLTLSLLLGTPVMSFVSAIGSALTVGLRRGGVLVSLIALPLYVPILIFGTGAVVAAADGFEVVGQLSLLGAMLALAICLAPFAIAESLRISASD